MKTFDERRKSVEENMRSIRKRRSRNRAMFGAVGCMVLVFAILLSVLFVPYDTDPPSMEQYAGDDYYQLIQKLNEATYQPPKYENRFDEWTSMFYQFNGITDGVLKGDQNNAMSGTVGTMAGVTGAPDTMNGAGEYVEVTDNQVAGVIEADIFKRSTKYIYYLNWQKGYYGYQLYVYSIEQEDSALVATYKLPFNQDPSKDTEENPHVSLSNLEMYLSQDGNTLTLAMQYYHDEAYTMLLNLDVKDPKNIREIGRVQLTGGYLSTRMVDGKFLVMSNDYINKNKIDFSDPTTFVPQVGTEGNMQLVDAEKILCPEELGNLNYTVVCIVDAVTLEVLDSAAFLSYSQQPYVSANAIYATYGYTRKTETESNSWKTEDVTEITGISYTGDSLEVLGSITLEGSVKNQYSMDEHNGILRVVTSTNSQVMTEARLESSVSVTMQPRNRNVNLYCVDLSKWEVAASVIGFAPEGESAESVRFDGEKAYVCTAVVITLKDPVYFFDLSDLQNITWTDTGTIDGYSTSLVQLGDGYLLGIGYGDSRQLKIEVYQEQEGAVVSVCSFELAANFSEDYKSYLIDRENDVVGLAVTMWKEYNDLYLLLQFDGQNLNVIATADVDGHYSSVRAVIIDGWLYVLSDIFEVKQVW